MKLQTQTIGFQKATHNRWIRQHPINQQKLTHAERKAEIGPSKLPLVTLVDGLEIRCRAVNETSNIIELQLACFGYPRTGLIRMIDVGTPVIARAFGSCFRERTGPGYWPGSCPCFGSASGQSVALFVLRGVLRHL